MDTSKIIKGAVSNGRYTVTAPIVKEDYGLYLQIEDIELPSTYEVDFSNNENSGTSVTMIGNADGVLIPRQFIASGKDVFAFLYHVGEDFGRTVYKFRIPNKVRPDRTNEEPTPEEQSVIDQAISALNEAVAQTAQDVIDADASAQSAQEYAEQAETARNAAQTYANNASASAQASANSATASAQSASASAQIKSDIEGMVDDAQGYAQASAQSATASANSATTAQGYANTASASAQSASTSASDALTYANTASSKASEASTSAQTASTKASESAQSASQALTYKTDAESAKTASQTAQGLAESARDSAISAKEDAESAKDDAKSARDEAVTAKNAVQGSADQIAQNAEDITDLKEDLTTKADATDMLKAFPTDTASDSVASFADGANVPVKSLIVNIEPKQEGSGDPSPDNVRPISGWSEVNVSQSGKFYVGAEYGSGDGFVQLAILKADNTTAENPAYFVTAYFPITPDSDCLVNAVGIYNAPAICFYDASKTFISGVSYANRRRFTVHTPSNCAYARMTIYNTNAYATGAYDNCTSINIPLGQTVYGGKLDVLSGELAVDRASVDMGTLTWRMSQQVGLFYTSNIGNVPPSSAIVTNKTLCSIYPVVPQQPTPSDKSLYISYPSGLIYVRDEDYSDYTSFVSAMNGVQLVYELATPITYQLTPNQVNSLLGVNNIWADSGDTEVEYRANTKLYINKKIAEALASLT